MEVQPHLLGLSAYINQNLEKDLPLSSLAKRVGLSPFHFHRKFGAYFGESLHQHIKRLRLERAAYALTHGSSPVRQIARDSGYKTVSAFSHAFSGFAGESPTRYRNLGAGGNRNEALHSGQTPEPAWIGEIAPIDIAFVRAMGSGRGAQPSVDAAIEVIRTRLTRSDDKHEGSGSNGANGSAAPAAPPLEIIAATSDVYGLSKTGDFRIDVGVDASGLSPERARSFGRQTLPGGRYARFDLSCRPEELIECCRVAMIGLKGKGETPRLLQYFVRFTVANDAEPGTAQDHQFFVPLAG